MNRVLSAVADGEARRAGPRLRWKLLRNRWLSDPRFHRLAARLPFVRRVAARESRALFDLCAGFVHTQVLLACVESGVLRAMQQSPCTTEALARTAGLPVPAAQRLLDAAAALRLVECVDDDLWVLGPLGAAMGGVESLEPMVRHHRLLYDDLRDPLALLRSGGPTRLGRYWAYAGRPDDPTDTEVADYSALMAASQELVAGDVLDAYPFGDHRCLLDVGGGEGAFVQAAARREPGLSLGLLDLPPVAARARASLASRGLGERITVHEGDFRRDPLPSGYDVITLVRVVHDHDDEVVLALLRAVRAALAPGGVCVIAEPMSGQRGAEAMADAYFGMYLLAMGQGRPRTPAGIADLGRRAGFTGARQCRTRRPLFASVVVLAP